MLIRPYQVTSISTVTATRSKMIYKTVTDYVTSTETLAPSRVTVNHIAAPTVKPVLANAPSNESLQALYEAVRVARSLTELYESLPEDLKQLARANPTVIDGLYGHFRWYEKSHAEIKGFAPKVAEEVDLTCSSNGTDTNAQGFSAIIAEPPKYDGCKAKIEKAKSEVSPAFRMEEDCSSIPDELRAGCPSVCGFYQATQG